MRIDGIPWHQHITSMGVEQSIERFPKHADDVGIALRNVLSKDQSIIEKAPELAWLHALRNASWPNASDSTMVGKTLGPPPSNIRYLPRFIDPLRRSDRLAKNLVAEGYYNMLTAIPSSNEIAMCNSSGLFCWDLDSATISAKHATRNHRNDAVVLSPDGKWIAMGAFNEPLILWNRHDKHALNLSELVSLSPEKLSDSVGVPLAFSTDSRRLVYSQQFSAGDRQSLLAAIYDFGNQSITRMSIAECTVYAATFCPDDQHIILLADRLTDKAGRSLIKLDVSSGE
ncbi:MAG: hypothetical protein R3C05_32200, partial [Pirellulaceae bacterium]